MNQNEKYLLDWNSDSAEKGFGFDVGGGSDGIEVCGLEVDTGGGIGAANIGGGKECIPSDTGGGVGRGAEVAVAGDNWDVVPLL